MFLSNDCGKEKQTRLQPSYIYNSKLQKSESWKVSPKSGLIEAALWNRRVQNKDMLKHAGREGKAKRAPKVAKSDAINHSASLTAQPRSDVDDRISIENKTLGKSRSRGICHVTYLGVGWKKDRVTREGMVTGPRKSREREKVWSNVPRFMAHSQSGPKVGLFHWLWERGEACILRKPRMYFTSHEVICR